MSFITNASTLTRSTAREHMLVLAESAYSAIDTEHVLRSSVFLSGDVLTIAPSHSMNHTAPITYDLSRFENVFIVGCGKIACRAAITLEDILASKVSGGAVVGLAENVCDIISTYKGTHPLPSHANFTGSSHVERVSHEAGERDLVIALIGGGGSAMLCTTQGECDQGQRLYEAFLRSGGTIDELNVVRRHISPLKGGGLAKVLYPATVVSLIFSDVPGGDPSTVASGPTYADATTIADAQAIINRYNLGSYELSETPKDSRYFERITNILMVSNETALHAVGHTARTLGYEAIIPLCDPYATCRDLVACMFASSRPQSVVCVGGEPRLAVPEGATGSGGRNSFTALEALSFITGTQVFAAIASDGHDNGESGGAIVDASTRTYIDTHALDIEAAKQNFDSHTLLYATHDLIKTNPIEANISDIFIVLSP